VLVAPRDVIAIRVLRHVVLGAVLLSLSVVPFGRRLM
jgi:hypothetical protein